MSYTPTSWSTGDAITAAAMTKIENGIANAGGGGFATVTVSATGYSSASRQFAQLVYARQVNGNWVVIDDNQADWCEVYGYSEPVYKVLPPQYTMISSDVYPFIVSVNADEVVTTGGVSNTPVNVYFNMGSLLPSGNGQGYRITGSGSIQFIAN